MMRLTLSTLLLLATPLLAVAQDQRAQEADLAIIGATVIDGTGSPAREGLTVLVRDGLIVAIDEANDALVPTGATLVDATGKFVIPGLTDTHVHFSLGAPLPRTEGVTATVLARQLYYGVTSIIQLGATDGSTEAIRLLREQQQAGTLNAPHIYGTGGHLTLQGTHPVYTLFPQRIQRAADSLAALTPPDEPVNLYPLGIGLSLVRTTAAAQKAVRERADGGMDAIKITVESGPTPFGDDHPQMSVEMIRAIVSEARRYNLPVFAHVSSRDELEASLAGGASATVHAARNLPLPDTALADAMATAGLFIAPTLSLYAPPVDLEDPFLQETVTAREVAALTRPEFFERVRQRWECCAPFPDLLANIGMLHARGVRIVLGTDTGNPFIFPGYSAHRELELLVEAGLSPMEALEAATRRAAEMIGAAGAFGTIEPGKRADMLVLGANPLDDIRNTRMIEVVVRGGDVIDRSSLLVRE